MLKLCCLILLIALEDCCLCGYNPASIQHPAKLETDFSTTRNLQNQKIGKLRVFVDYTQLSTGGLTQINTIKRVMNISANYFYNVFNVSRLERLYYEQPILKCDRLKVPEVYKSKGTYGDLGIICGNEHNTTQQFLAQAKICSYSKIDSRPIWGIIIWNNVFLKYDQRGFQQMVFTGFHQLVHVLGFSADAYHLYRNGNPLVEVDDSYYLSTPLLDKQVRSHYNCNSFFGLPLEDQDGSAKASSHWDSKVVGTEFMGPSAVKHALISRFTLALLESTGWYKSVDYSYAEPNQWGKNQGCDFLNINHCQGEQFCHDKAFYCEADGTGIGRCQITPFKGACKTPKSYIQLVCTSQYYQYQNLNGQLNALQRGGSQARCFESDFRQQGLQATLLNNRCYIAVCSLTGNFIFILLGQQILVCRSPGLVITAPVGLIGTLTCPKNFAKYCKGKKTCPYHCNNNGACIDGQCLCTGQTKLSPSCINENILIAPVGTSSGLMLNRRSIESELIFGFQEITPNITTSSLQIRKYKTYNINSRCLQGTFSDPVFGQCISCHQNFGCHSCSALGCIVCDDGSNPSPINLKC